MSADFSSIQNANERFVFNAVMDAAPSYPALAENDERLADVACVALGRLPPRYIRHPVDYAFFLTDKEREQTARQVAEAVAFAFHFVQAREAMGARG